MPRKKSKTTTIEDIENSIKLLCDQSNNHMKVREYDKALRGYNQFPSNTFPDTQLQIAFQSANTETMPDRLKDYLAPDKDQELLQSFVRVGLNVDEETDDEPHFSSNRLSSSKYARGRERRKSVRFRDSVPSDRMEKDLLRQSRKNKLNSESLKKKKPRENFNDTYTDKDRAAAVSAGSYDIKQSLKIKSKQERTEAMAIPDEADINSFISLGMKELKNANTDNAILCFSKALELNSQDLNALVSRSKCYLLLGEASKALEDAETALATDKTSIRATYQKAESLYYLGQFEQSLMFFHRGLRARPELASFRLGVQKTQEAIENTIGMPAEKNAPLPPLKSGKSTPKSVTSQRPKAKSTKADVERRNSRKLLGELCVDKEYLENLLKNPDLKRADTNSENISTYAKEAVDFLNKRQEFWRQQRTCTALPNQKNLPLDSMPGWF